MCKVTMLFFFPSDKKMPRANKTKTTEPENPPAEDVVEEVSQQEDQKKTTTKKKRTYKLHLFKPEEGRGAPKNGGSYKSLSPAAAARKAANRWVIAKDEFDKVRTFFLREVGAEKGHDIYEFSAKRIKLKSPKTYKRGEKEITVNSRIEIVAKPNETEAE